MKSAGMTEKKRGGDGDEKKGVGGNKMDFNEIMRQAVQLKGAQMSKYRKKFDGWPKFLQNTLMYTDEFKAPRSLPYVERMDAAAKMKASGRLAFAEGHFDQARTHYEQALGVFRFVKPTVDDWRKRGLADDTLQCVDFLIDGNQDEYTEGKKGTGEGKERVLQYGGKGENEGVSESGYSNKEGGSLALSKQQVRKFQISCYINIAICSLKCKEWNYCVRACDHALELDDENIKALYRRAKARILATTSGATEMEMALKDLTRAMASAEKQGDDTNGRVVRRELNTLRAALRRQRNTDRATFSGLFERSRKVGGSSLYDGSSSSSSSGERGINKEARRVRQELDMAKRIIREHRMAGREEEAKALERKLKEVNDEIDRRRERARRDHRLNFEDPTEEMIREAKKSGIDLTDPNVKAYLKILERQKRSKGDGEEIDADAANAEYEELRRRSQMERKEYEESEQGEREGGGEREHRALDGMMRAREEAGLGGRRGRDERGRARGRQNRLLFVIMFLFLMYRFYCIGVFGWIARLLADLFGFTPSESTMGGEHAGAHVGQNGGDDSSSAYHGHFENDEWDEF